MIDVLNLSPLDTQGLADLVTTFSGKYIFVGESGTIIHDSFVSPVTGKTADGVETHAHLLDALLQNKLLMPIETNIMLVLVGLLTLFTVIIYYTVPKYLSQILAIAILCGLLFALRWSYDSLRILGDATLVFLAGAIVTYPMTFIYRFFVVDREKRELQNNF